MCKIALIRTIEKVESQKKLGFWPMMKQQEEKKIKVHKRQRRQSNSSSSSLPLDLISEILLRLSEKSVVRFRCVSKAWSSITTDPYFINLFKTRSPRLLLCVKASDKFFVSSIPQHHQTFEASNKSYSSSQLIDPYHMEFPINIYPIEYSPTESVQGLICFNELTALIVWNPSTRKLLTLRHPRKSWNDFAIFLGYDPVESKHKVMCLPYLKSSDECRVLTLGSPQESWRTVKTNLNTDVVYHTSGRCIKGVVYYLAYDPPTYVLMSFDVRSEKFNKIQLPPSDFYQDMLLAYQGRLACIGYEPNKKKGIRLWILEDAEKHKWSSKKFLVPRLYYDERLRNYLVLRGFTHTGEFIYVANTFGKSSCIVLYDPVRNSCRRFELKGITGDESVLINIYQLYIFPNHVDNRVSL